MVDGDGHVGVEVHLTDAASKGRGGRVIPMNRHLREKLIELFEQKCDHHSFNLASSHVIRTERADQTTPQAIVNMFAAW
jgi:integrase/recombinase XerD